MAIKINNVDVITNTPNIVNVQNANFTGIVTATSFAGTDGTNLQSKIFGVNYIFGS
jgi:hypothetical protein